MLLLLVLLFRDWLQLHYLTTVTLDPVYAKEVSSSRITFVTKPCCFLISGKPHPFGPLKQLPIDR
jgi:hypothetical protein